MLSYAIGWIAMPTGAGQACFGCDKCGRRCPEGETDCKGTLFPGFIITSSPKKFPSAGSASVCIIRGGPYVRLVFMSAGLFVFDGLVFSQVSGFPQLMAAGGGRDIQVALIDEVKVRAGAGTAASGNLHDANVRVA